MISVSNLFQQVPKFSFEQRGKFDASEFYQNDCDQINN